MTGGGGDGEKEMRRMFAAGSEWQRTCCHADLCRAACGERTASRDASEQLAPSELIQLCSQQ